MPAVVLPGEQDRHRPMFALESAIDDLAQKLNMDPLEFRKKNACNLETSVLRERPIVETTFSQVCDDIKPLYEKAKKDG